MNINQVGPKEFKCLINDGCSHKIWRTLHKFEGYDLGVYGKGYRIKNLGGMAYTPVRLTITGRTPRKVKGTWAIRVMIEFLNDDGESDYDHGYAIPTEWN